MREGFTDQLRLALDRGQESARSLHQEYVSTEHLFLGVIQGDGSEAVDVLTRAEVNLNDLRKDLLTILPHGGEDPLVSGNLPLSPKAQQAIQSALVKARTGQESQVTTRLILCALLEEPETIMRQALRDVGTDLDHLQRLLTEPPADGEE